ncbi:two-component sensor histidine kinase [Acinetobacter sp. S40]|uniref:ATP-binding protein n=1 Tax=Acinetobacter sp. S40 TaxID=2767434 RepID=UPI00190CABD2|nr:ATP-binding protein [Acinetobacter sp. S40]MBJ9984825.1 two-component sensor histidine kinase [Acinetobacter sp. S40]
MNRPVSVSLQSKIIKTTVWSSVIAGITAFALLIFLTCYHNMKVQDEIMDEVSDMLLLSDRHLPSGQQLDELSDEFDLQYALYWNNKLLTQSKEHDSLPLQWNFKTDFSLVWQDGQIWRIYRQDKTQAELKSVVIQPLSTRFDEIWQSLMGYFLVLIVLWLLQWGLIRWGIRRDLAPLHHLSHSIATKSAHDLQPISMMQTPLEIEPVIDSLNQLLQRLERALLAQQSFTADASHELRSPLSAIQMRLQLIQRKYNDKPALKQDLIQIQNDVNRSTQVLENLLLLARLDPAQEQGLIKHLLMLDEILLEVIEALSLFAHDKNIEIILDCNAQQTQIKANHELIFTCLRNLLDNAIRYSPYHSKVYIHLENMQQYSGKLRLNIHNDGEKITPQVMERLGQRFFRGLGTGQQGTGLGLSITQKIVLLHQAKLNFYPNPNGGLEVELIFDIAEC